MKLKSHLLSSLWGLTSYLILVVNCLYNAALYKPAWQSSVYFDGYPYLANDGSRDKKPTETHRQRKYACQITGIDHPAWWMVDLQGQYVIQQVIVTYRVHRGGFRIESFETDPRRNENFLNITGDICYVPPDTRNAETHTWNCTPPVVGRFVRLVRNYPGNLQNCEVEVMTSRFFQRFTSFAAFLNSTLDNPSIASLSGSTPRQCVRQCLVNKDGNRCTAFNWNRNENECQLLSIDTRSPNDVTTQLMSTDGVDFYMEVHHL